MTGALFLPFKENTILTGPGEEFPIPLAYKGNALYFRSLEHVKVPQSLQANLAYELSRLFKDGGSTLSRTENTEVGRVTVTDGDKQRVFEVTITLVKSAKDDEWRIDSILEVT